MPKHIKGESRASWMKRCIPYVIKHEGLDKKAAGGRCAGMWDEHKKKQRKHSESTEDDIMDEDKYERGKYYAFKFDSFDGNKQPTEFNCIEFIEQATSKKGYNMVIALGNTFMKGIYVSKEEMKAKGIKSPDEADSPSGI